MYFFQKILLFIYSLSKKIGLIDNNRFRNIFLSAYFLYKRFIEDPFYDLTQKYPEMFQNGNILDIGANIGYTSVIFSWALSKGFKVYAFEPDKENFTALKEIIVNKKEIDRIIPINAAVGAQAGKAILWLNENHHADHKIMTDAYSKTGIDVSKISNVEMVSIDSFTKKVKIESTIKFIKIDVQGYELAVCLGMRNILLLNPDAVIGFEYMPASMTELGFDPEEILSFFGSRGYNMYILHRGGKLETVKENTINSLLKKRKYVDLICSKKQLIYSKTG